MKYGKFDIFLNGEAVGKVDVSRHGLLTCVMCTAEYESQKVLRLASDNGEGYSVIGVMMPSEKGYFLEKNLTKNDIYIKKLDNAEKYVLIAEGESYTKSAKDENVPEETENVVWQPCKNPSLLFADAEAGAALEGIEGILKAEYEDKTYIAVPVRKDAPFPPLPIFYFGQQGKMKGEEYS